jgi:integrase
MLTDTEIKRAIRAATKDTTLNDGAHGRGTGSLRLRIRPGSSGTTATWVAWWKQGGKRATKPLGKYPAMSLSDARALFVAEVAPVVRAGKNPRVKTVAEGKPTVGRMFEAYVESMKAKGRVSAGEVERALLKAENNAADALGRHRICADIEPGDVVDFVSGFYRRGARGQADKSRSYISSAFNWALKAAHDYTVEIRQDWGIKINPAAAIPRDHNAVTQRDRNLSTDELRVLWHAATPGLNGFTLETSTAVRMLIGTGQRVQEVLRVDGSEIDLRTMTWNMPAEKTKGRKRPHAIPLPKQVADALKTLKQTNGSGALFPGAVDGRMDHRSIMQAIDRWIAQEDVHAEKFQTRDLRRTWKSRAGELGISKEMRDLIQQHAKNDTGSKNYDRADYLPQMREAMKVWERYLMQIVQTDAKPGV